eukprot:TRINITY_DN2374_c0_g1_i1.p1 TRINITY_DN2374_c0_g1~~TRINITY_DN2374_c0_g1_i1.p1  ORF type:complete len:379 (+),score=56.34 TRINITY_DN2374_c0_g1_i1:83-1219(+)
MEKDKPLPFHIVYIQNDWFLVVSGNYIQVFSRGKLQPVESEDLKNNGHTGIIRACSFSSKGELCVTGGDDKQLIFWDTTNWKIKYRRKTPKKITSVHLSETHVIFADKTGEVDTLLIKSDYHSQQPQLLLGHFSSVTALLLSPDEKYVLTADRDEKIRVSHYPNAYNIRCFCLGHTEFVSKLIIPYASKTLLISGGADGTLRIWDYLSGVQLHTTILLPLLMTNTTIANKEVVSSIVHSSRHDLFAVSVENYPGIMVFKLVGHSDSLHFELIQKISLDKVLNLSFDEEGVLWVVGSDTIFLRGFAWNYSEFTALEHDSLLSLINQYPVREDTTSKVKIEKALELENLRKVQLEEYRKRKIVTDNNNQQTKKMKVDVKE